MGLACLPSHLTHSIQQSTTPRAPTKLPGTASFFSHLPHLHDSSPSTASQTLNTNIYVAAIEARSNAPPPPWKLVLGPALGCNVPCEANNAAIDSARFSTVSFFAPTTSLSSGQRSNAPSRRLRVGTPRGPWQGAARHLRPTRSMGSRYQHHNPADLHLLNCPDDNSQEVRDLMRASPRQKPKADRPSALGKHQR